jgi:hypothetical protein
VELACHNHSRRLDADTDFSSMGARWAHPQSAGNAQRTKVVPEYDDFRDALLMNFKYCHENDEIMWLKEASLVRPRA